MRVSMIGWKNSDEYEAVTRRIQEYVVVIACQSVGDMVTAGYYYPKAQVTVKPRYAIQFKGSDGVLVLGDSPWIAYAVLSGKNVFAYSELSSDTFNRITALASRIGVSFTNSLDVKEAMQWAE